jgi:cob(I)alamin adenosyltransferase
MKIYTRTGDDGETSLLGGNRVPKDALRVEAYGAVDELNALLGLVSSETGSEKLRETVGAIQQKLFVLGTELATPAGAGARGLPQLGGGDVTTIENIIDAVEDRLPPLTKFILPGGTREASFLHIARTVCRRAERACVRLSHAEPVSSGALIFLNRLSDLLFVLAREANLRAGAQEIEWTSSARAARDT